MQSNTVSVLGVRIANLSLVQAVDQILENAADHEQLTQFAFVNADCLNIACENPDYRALLANVAGVFGDGSGVRYACKLTGQQIIDNVNGTDLFPLLCEKARAGGKSIFFLGGRPGVAERAAKRAAQRYPGLRIAGTQHGFFAENETDGVIDDINASDADVLLVAFGAPKQDQFIAEHASRLKVGAAIGVGGLFDFLGKEVGRANGVVRRLGFEWMVRFLNEPKRMFRRYILGNPLFLWRVIRSGKVDGQVSPTPSPATDFRLSGSRFDLWQDFEVLDEVTDKYLAADSGQAAKRADGFGYWWRTRSYLPLKRALDIIAASIGILVLAPVYLATALAIFLDNPGPIIYRQQRVGFRGRLFTMYKFRSMRVNADALKADLAASNESAAGVLFKMKRDPRVTRVGRIIRKLSIDELPQLFNVLLGDMTLVGPRPPVPQEVSEYSLAQRARLEVVPGITCIWQVSGRSDIDFTGQVELDLRYIRERTLVQDILLLIKTVPAVLLGKGAY